MRQRLLKLTQHFNCIHFAGGYPGGTGGYPRLAPGIWTWCIDKLTADGQGRCMPIALGKERVEDVMEMIRISGALDG